MRTIITETNVYTIDELTGEALKRAIENVQEERSYTVNEFDVSDFLESAKMFAEKFGFEVTDWSIGTFGRNYIVLDGQNYTNLSNEEKNDLVKELNDTWKSESDGECSLTGTYTDCYFYDYFKTTKGTTYNTIHKDIPAATDVALKAFISDMEETLTNDEDAKQHANDIQLEFTKYGSIYS